MPSSVSEYLFSSLSLSRSVPAHCRVKQLMSLGMPCPFRWNNISPCSAECLAGVLTCSHREPPSTSLQREESEPKWMIVFYFCLLWILFLGSISLSLTLDRPPSRRARAHDSQRRRESSCWRLQQHCFSGESDFINDKLKWLGEEEKRRSETQCFGFFSSEIIKSRRERERVRAAEKKVEIMSKLIRSRAVWSLCSSFPLSIYAERRYRTFSIFIFFSYFLFFGERDGEEFQF